MMVVDGNDADPDAGNHLDFPKIIFSGDVDICLLFV
jgi:hypothetical protein